MTNHVTLSGLLGRDAEVRTLPSGKSVLNFSIATSDNYKDKKTGEWVNSSDWHNVQLFNPTEYQIKKFKKGTRVFLTGKYKSSTYTRKDGTQARDYHVIADHAHSLEKDNNADTANDVDIINNSSLDSDIPF